MTRIGLCAAVALAAGILCSGAAARPQVDGPFPGSPNHPAIEYDARPVHDAVAALNARLAGGDTPLAFEGRSGFLRSVLAALDIPNDSQVLVFSKTGVQGGRTGPSNPRALLFNDAVVLGYIPGAPFIEIAAQDPQQGTIFYTLDQSPQASPRFARQARCLGCHLSFNTLDVPGMLVRSQFTAADGASMRQLGQFLVDHRTPFAQRWGGYYVTSPQPSVAHMGNAMVLDRTTPIEPSAGATLTAPALASRVDLTTYPAASSDMVALMVFDHQMRMMNLLTRVGWETRVAASEQRLDTAHGAERIAIGELVDYMLFVDEAPFPRAVPRSSPFADRFAAQGPQDRKHRSFRDLDVQRRLLRYPCSYMIYSKAFDGLPGPAKDAVYRRLWAVLSGEEKDARYRRLTRTDRQAIVEILRDTRAGLPGYFSAAVH